MKYTSYFSFVRKKMIFGAHGTFDLSRKGDIYTVRFLKNWNLEGVKSFFETYKRTIIRDNLQRFGVLADLRALEGGTPEAIEYFDVIPDWTAKHGQVARALLLNTAYEDFIRSRIDKDKTHFPLKMFDNEPEALLWLAGFGLSVF